MRGRTKWQLRKGCISLVLAAVLVCMTGAAANAYAGLAQSRLLSLDISDRFVNDPAAHRIIALSGSSSTPLSLTFVDDQTFSESAPVTFSGYVNQGFAAGKPSVFAFDETNRKLYVVAYHTLEERVAVVNPLLVTIDVDRLTISEQKISALFPPGFRALGMAFENGRLMLTGQLQPEAVFATVPRTAGAMVVEIDPNASVPGSAAPLITFGPQVIRGCQGLISNQSQNVVAVRDQTIFVSCATSSLSAVTMPGVPGIIAMPMANPASVRVSFLPGSYTLGDVFVDSVAQRLLLVGSAPQRPAQAVWVFDLAHEVFLGQVAAGDLNVYAAGVNQANGRIYVGISAQNGDGSLLVSDDRGIEIPQALSYSARPIVGVITPIESNRSVIIPVQPSQGLPYYAVFTDSIPDSQIQPVNLIDYSAIDRSKTDQPQFSGDAQAFGIRIHEMGGVNGVGQNIIAQQGVDYWSQTGGQTGLRDGDRDVTFAPTITAHLSQNDASATASELRADDNTDHDYNQLRNQDLSAPEAHCDDFGGSPTSSSSTTATTSCSQSLGDVQTSSSSARVSESIVTVGASSSSSHLTRVGNGVSITSHAEARSIEIGGVVHIGYASSDATASASGSPGGANATYVRTFRNVSAPGFSCAASCDVSAVLKMISDTLGSQVRVEMPDPEVLKTPGGAHAHAMRDPWQHEQDVVINNQQTTETQVPALRIIYVADNATASRIMIELAGADANATARPIGSTSQACACPQTQAPTAQPSTYVLGRSYTSTPHDAPAKPQSFVQRFLTKLEHIVGHGWNILFPTSPSGYARAAFVWAILLAPFVLAIRRRELGGVRSLKP
ncbi:MAG: hypothetical protein ACYDCC_06770 [Actinomycetota bacterium]